MTPMRHTLLLAGSIVTCIAAGPGCTGANWWSRQTASAPSSAETDATRARVEIDRNLQEGSRYEASGDFASARLSYQQVLSLDAGHTLAHHRLGVLADREGRGAEAQEHYRLAYESDPRNTDLLSDVGYSFALQGDFDAAERVLADSLHIDPQHGRSLANMRLVKQRRAEQAASLTNGSRATEQNRGMAAAGSQQPAISPPSGGAPGSEWASPAPGGSPTSRGGEAAPWNNGQNAVTNRNAPSRHLSGPELQAYFAEIDRRDLPDGRPIHVEAGTRAVAGPQIMPAGGEAAVVTDATPTTRSASPRGMETMAASPAMEVSRTPGPIISPAIVRASAVDSGRGHKPSLNVTAAELGLRAGGGLPQFALPTDAEPPSEPVPSRPAFNGSNPSGSSSQPGSRPPPWNTRSANSNRQPQTNSEAAGQGPHTMSSPAVNPALYEERQAQTQTAAANARRALPADPSSRRPNDPTQWMNAGSPFHSSQMPAPQTPPDWSQFLSSNGVESPSIPSAQGRVFNGGGASPARSFGDPNSNANASGPGANSPQVPTMTPATPIPEPTGLKRYLKLPSWTGRK